VFEFNVNDMKTFKAEWSLPINISSFAISQSHDGKSVILAGGLTKSSSDLYPITTK
jgi:hypothetical protein